jgi:predicted dehydrogenase
MNLPPSPEVSRRRFLQQSSTAATLAALSRVGPVFAAASDRIRVGLVGCGARGTGAAMNCVMSSPGVEITALGDVFTDRVDGCLRRLKDNAQDKAWDASAPWRQAEQVKATPETCFTGFEAIQKVLAAGVDLVILAGPPHFRPAQLRAAVEAGKHVFMEKPVAVDPVGIRSILESADIAKQKGLAIVAGTQRRHQNAYVELMKRVREGAIGEIVAGEAYWNGGCVRHYGFLHPRQPGWSDFETMLRNWYFHTWLSGDHLVEQHVHNLDVINWAIGSPPVEAIGVGGRQWRTEPEFGNIFDHFGIRYRYANGAVVVSTARQIDGTEPRVGEGLIGTRGRASAGGIEGANAWRWEGPNPNPYEQEHADLITSIRVGAPLNEGQAVAEATLTAIMGRIAAYTGQRVTWDFVLEESKLDLTPPEFRQGQYRLGPAPLETVATGTGRLA